MILVWAVDLDKAVFGWHLVLESQGRSIARAMAGEAFGRSLRFQLSQSAWKLCLWLLAQVAMRLAPAHT